MPDLDLEPGEKKPDPKKMTLAQIISLLVMACVMGLFSYLRHKNG